MIGPRASRNGWVVLGVVLPLLAACESVIGERAPPIVYHILAAVPAAEEENRPEGLRRGVIVGVVPVNLPDYLDTPQMVVRSTRNTLERSELHQWGAPLAENFANALADNLGAMIPTDQVIVLPGSAAVRADYHVAVEVSKFERDTQGLVTLVARWALLGDDGTSLISVSRSVYSLPAPADDYDAIAAAMSDTLAKVSEDIAAALRSGGRSVRRGAAGV